MSLSDLPTELLAQISSYLYYCDICSLMQTNKNNYNIIKLYGNNKIALQWFTFWKGYSEEATLTLRPVRDSSDKLYSFRNLDIIEDDSMKIIRMLNECDSIERLAFEELKFDSTIMKVVMETKAKIRSLYIHSLLMHISIEEMLKLCQKLKNVFFYYIDYDSRIWDDEVFTKMLPGSSINRGSYSSMENVNYPGRITNRTLNSLVTENGYQKHFGMAGVHNSITIKELIRIIKIVHVQNLDWICWSLGILQPNLANEAELYLGEKGELEQICGVSTRFDKERQTIDYRIESRQRNKFTIYFEIALPSDYEK